MSTIRSAMASQLGNTTQGFGWAGELFDKARGNFTNALNTQVQYGTNEAINALMQAKNQEELQRLSQGIDNRFIDQGALNAFIGEQNTSFRDNRLQDEEIKRDIANQKQEQINFDKEFLLRQNEFERTSKNLDRNFNLNKTNSQRNNALQAERLRILQEEQARDKQLGELLVEIEKNSPKSVISNIIRSPRMYTTSQGQELPNLKRAANDAVVNNILSQGTQSNGKLTNRAVRELEARLDGLGFSANEKTAFIGNYTSNAGSALSGLNNRFMTQASGLGSSAVSGLMGVLNSKKNELGSLVETQEQLDARKPVKAPDVFDAIQRVIPNADSNSKSDTAGVLLEFIKNNPNKLTAGDLERAILIGDNRGTFFDTTDESAMEDYLKTLLK